MSLWRFHYYHVATGVIHTKHVTTDQAVGAEEFARMNAPSDHEVIEGSYEYHRHVFDLKAGKVVEKASS